MPPKGQVHGHPDALATAKESCLRAALKPVWDGHEFQPRLMLPLSLSYDHRVIDGADAARFTTRLAQVLSDIRILLL